MTGERTVKVRFTGEETDLRRASNQAARDLEDVKAGVSDLNRAAVVASTAVLAGIGLFVAQGAAALVNVERLNAQTTQAIKSTQAAWTDTKHLTDYADKIEHLTGIEREQVQEGQNLLLTFTNIQNKVGEGNDIFDQATTILTDMATAMGTDVKTSAIQLGKALNDPVKGITALTKVGVTFTQQQREQIEAMQEAGDIAGAQKVILAELAKEFGGSAAAFGETTAGELAKLKNALGDTQEELATAFSPAIREALDLLKSLAQWAKDNPDSFKNITMTIGGVAAAVLVLNAAVETYRAVVTVATIAQWLWNAAMIANPIGLVIVAIGAIVVGIGLIVAGLNMLGVTWDDVWSFMGDTVQSIWDAQMRFWNFLFAQPTILINTFSSIAGGLANPFVDAFNWIARAWNNSVGTLSADIPGIGHVDVPDIPYASRRQHGGDVRAGMPYWVGEAGPELFTPGQSGRVSSNAESMAGGGDTYVTVMVGGETIAATARAERVRASKRTRRWVLAAQGGRA